MLNKPVKDYESVEELWEGFIKIVYPSVEEDSIQYTEMKKAFFAGALCLFLLITWTMTQMDEGEEPTEKDLDRMDEIYDELKNFMLTQVVQDMGVPN